MTSPPDGGAPVPICDRIVCSGRRLDRDGAPTGEPCGASWHARCGRRHHVDRIDQALALEVTAARAAGWRVGPADARGVHNAMCPRCAAPDPALTKACAELAHRASTQLGLDI